MSIDGLAVLGCVLASVPAVNVLCNLWLYRPAPRLPAERLFSTVPGVSLLIPARNEEANIGTALQAASRSQGVELEIVVMDDHSSDRTADIVHEMARQDDRIRLLSAPALPAGWCGKQHACFQLARKASREFLVFIDADVILAPDALLRMLAFLERSDSDLASGIPFQRTESWLEKTVVPLIHFVLLGFLPLVGMRHLQGTAWAAGCGQLFVARRAAYDDSGGHRAIRHSRHDGLMLPRAFRKVGRRTDLFDATDLAACRMYSSTTAVWQGFAKNATEGMASATAIIPWTLLLIGGQVVPPVLLGVGSLAPSQGALAYSLAGTLLVFGTRLVLTARFHQSWLGALLHPIGIVIVVAIQWYALGRSLAGRPLAWKGRSG